MVLRFEWRVAARQMVRVGEVLQDGMDEYRLRLHDAV